MTSPSCVLVVSTCVVELVTPTVSVTAPTTSLKSALYFWLSRSLTPFWTTFQTLSPRPERCTFLRPGQLRTHSRPIRSSLRGAAVLYPDSSGPLSHRKRRRRLGQPLYPGLQP